MKRVNLPGGEVQVTVGPRDFVPLFPTTRYNLWSSDDIMAMLLEQDARYRARPSVDRSICIPHVPYAQHDHVANEGEPLSIKVMADLINYIKASSVEIWDPPSNVLAALIDNIDVIDQTDLIRYSGLINRMSSYDAIVSSGTDKEYKATKTADCFSKPLIRTIKQDSYTSFFSNKPMSGTTTRFLVVKDICEDEKDLVELGGALHRNYSNTSLDLYVTHGIFSNGFGELLGVYDKIYCANPRTSSYRDEPRIELLYKPNRSFYAQQ